MVSTEMKTPFVIIVTGTPGTGKTTVAKKLAKQKKAIYLDVNKIIKQYKLNKNYSKKWKSYLVDVDKLNKILIKIIKEHQKKKQSLVIDSHLSHYLPKRYVDLCLVTKCSLKKLQQRLKKRRYSAKKIRENMDAEIFDVCLLESIVNKHRAKIVKT